MGFLDFLQDISPILIASGVALLITHQYQKKKDRTEILSKIFDNISNFFIDLYSYMFTLPQKKIFDAELSMLKLNVNNSGYKLDDSLLAYLNEEQYDSLSSIREKMSLLTNEITTLDTPIKFSEEFVLDKSSRMINIRTELIRRIKLFEIT